VILSNASLSRSQSQTEPDATPRQHPLLSPPLLPLLLLSLLRNRQTDDAYSLFSRLPRLPNSVCLSRLLAQLSLNSKTKPASLSRAKALVQRLASTGDLHRFDNNSLGLLASAAARAGHADFAASLVRSMLKSDLLPHVRAWTGSVSALAEGDSSADALRLFHQVIRRIRRELESDMSRKSSGKFSYNHKKNSVLVLYTNQ
jgi:hypothetical protein